jgi:hypothetical protein
MTLATTRIFAQISSTSASDDDRAALQEHLGRDALHASYDRRFSRAYFLSKDGKRVPKMHRFGSRTLPQCEYAVLVDDSRRCVLVVDVDQDGTAGGWAECINPDVLHQLNALAARGLGPAWVGVNPTNGRCQAIWMIDPVYAAPGRRSSNIELWETTARELSEFVGGDHCFSRKFSRNPFCTNGGKTAYFWHCQHTHIHRVRDLLDAVRGTHQEERMSSGRARIEAARAAARSTRQADENAAEYPSDIVDGIRVYWSEPGIAMRDETAFRHALRSGYELKSQGKRLTDRAIIDAYLTAYQTAQEIGAGLRPSEIPSVRDLDSMARRVRSYVYAGKSVEPERMTVAQSSAGRKALATMGRKGGQKSAQRWKTDPDSEYAQGRRETLAAANARRALSGDVLESKVKAALLEARVQQANDPTSKELAAEFGVSVRRIQQVRKTLGLAAKRGRAKKSETP